MAQVLGLGHGVAANSGWQSLLDKISMLSIISITGGVGVMGKLGALLAQARRRQHLTLRAVEAETGISNAYLSQLEHGKIRSPSPVVLSKLSQLYHLPYALVLEQAGYPVPADKAEMPDAQLKLAARLGPVTAEEEEALVDYLEFLRSKRKRGGRK